MKKFFLTFLFLVISFQFCFAQINLEGREFISDGVRPVIILDIPKEEAEILKSRWTEIGKEIKTTDNLVAGTYEQAGNRGSYLRISPKNGFVFINHYEGFNLVAYSYGKVEINGSEVTFITEKGLTTTLPNGEAREFPRRWIAFGKFLIEENRIKDYADYLSGLGDFNDWRCDCWAFFSKISENPSPEYKIPDKYKSLFRPPIEGEIISVGEEKLFRRENRVPEIETQVKINVGKNEGVREGMIFRFYAGKGVEREMTVIKVNKQDSLALISDGIFEEEKGLFATYYDYETKTHKPLPKTKVGTKISTKLFPWTEK